MAYQVEEDLGSGQTFARALAFPDQEWNKLLIVDHLAVSILKLNYCHIHELKKL